MSHLRPDHIALYARGRLSDGKARRVTKHLEGCPACRIAYERVRAAQDGLRAAAEAAPPEVGSVRTEATLRWLRVPAPRAARPIFVAALGAAAAAAGLLALLPHAPVEVPRVAPAPQPVAVRPVEDRDVQAIVTLLAGRVELARAGVTHALGPAALLAAGDALTTAKGARVAAQWAEGSAFLLDHDATLALDKLKEHHQALLLPRGQVDVRVATADDTAEVTTPAHAVQRRPAAGVSVRSAWFTVAADGPRTTVEVLEGEVVVTELGGFTSTVLRAPARAVFTRGHTAATGLAASELQGRGARPPLLAWPGVPNVNVATGLLRVSGTGELNVDGVPVGATPVYVREPVGLHHVVLRAPGQPPLMQVADVRAGAEALLNVPRPQGTPVEPPSLESVMLMHKGALRACYERSLKHDGQLAGTVSLRLKVGGDGHVRTTRIEDSTLADAQVGECVAREAEGWTFDAGQAFTVVYPFEFRPE